MTYHCVVCGESEGCVQCAACPRSVCPRHAKQIGSDTYCPRCYRKTDEEDKR
jgi:hypothetical protein